MEQIGYPVCHETKTVLIKPRKVASSAMGIAMRSREHDDWVIGAKALWNECKGYTVIIVVREPMDRFNSFYRAKNPPCSKGKRLIKECFYGGKWSDNSHVVPITNYIAQIYKWPDIILRYENLEEDFEIIRERFPGTGNLEKRNVSPRERDIWRDYDKKTLKFIRDKFIIDYENFNYPIPVIEE